MKIFAAWSSALRAESSWKTSHRQDKLILWVLEMCLSFGEYRFLTTRMVAWLSSRTLRTTLRPNSSSQSCRAGKPSWYNECTRDTTSDSVVDRDVEVCLLLTQANGKNVFGPYRIRTPLKSICRSNDPPQNLHLRRDGVL